MNGYALLLLAPLAFPLGAPPSDPVQSELRQFQGAWQAASMTHPDGRQATANELARTRLVVDGDRFTFTGKDYTITGRFEIDPGQTPKAINAVLDGEPTVTLLGIYFMDGTTRKSCFAISDKERPKAFPASGKGYMQFEWKRPDARK
jgi:uncharacterized protein (TIGR03067 family)